MFSQLGDKLQEIFKDLRGHGTISEVNIDAALRQVRLALLEADAVTEGRRRAAWTTRTRSEENGGARTNRQKRKRKRRCGRYPGARRRQRAARGGWGS